VTITTAPETKTRRQLKLSPMAHARLIELSKARDELVALRIEVVVGDPDGFTYSLKFTPLSELTADDEICHLDGVIVVASDESAALLAGATLSYGDLINAHGFSISNPNISRPGPLLQNWRFLAKVNIDNESSNNA